MILPKIAQGTGLVFAGVLAVGTCFNNAPRIEDLIRDCIRGSYMMFFTNPWAFI